MGLFSPYQRDEDKAEPVEKTPAVVSTEPAKPAKKTVPTPTRREAEQARRERVHPSLSPKQARAKDREQRAVRRDEQLRATEAAPGRVLLRDWVDSRRGISGWAMPAIMATLVLSLVATSWGPVAVAAISYLTWIILAAIIVDLVLMWRGYKKLHAARLPREPLKGLLSYGINRSINIRRLRAPAARVKPGDKI
ncbi:MAG: DUF3043 domain-containing protein [Propionicimonas sp.]|uniref:DUF3043 domain-containing protein n=1 Tax=Propionicimonas sp. TaxID=1955623 RepID=UPI002B1FDF6B|nr:DUF3043 domain-containing protein [Propionicimonas sp.]MEA4944077.1 DUF3043 domain-containing protein [Propionicimonas sp.]MEA5054980.1 DUF3043 domain-containing protein [Propionicimonas sp.]MEA5118320.1 DUF3043 domain-containing protein [Propionicimonas sp.]